MNEILPTGWDIVPTLNIKEMVLLANGEIEGVWEKAPKRFFEIHALYFGYKCDQHPFLNHKSMGKAWKNSNSYVCILDFDECLNKKTRRNCL